MKTLVQILLVFVVIAMLFAYPVALVKSAETVTITVSEKERIATSESSKYLVWSEEGEVFENTDSMVFWKFASSDVQGELVVGQQFTATVAGWRVPFLSMYRNIIEIKKNELTYCIGNIVETNKNELTYCTDTGTVN